MFQIIKEFQKMNCMNYRDRIDEYIEGKLRNDEKVSFEEHLQQCPECTELVRLQKFTDRIISEEKQITPDFHFTDKIMAGLEETGKGHDSALVLILRPIIITVAVAASIFAGILLGNISEKPALRSAPVELMLMNDIAMESVNILSEE